MADNTGVGYGEESPTPTLREGAEKARYLRHMGGDNWGPVEKGMVGLPSQRNRDAYNSEAGKEEKTAKYQQDLAKESVASGDTRSAVGHAKAAKALRERGDTISSLKSYDKGGVVTKTGPAIVHKGERIIPVKDSPLSKPRAKKDKDSKDGKKKHKNHKLRIHVSMADSGGFRADHDPHQPEEGPMVEGATHNLSNLDALKSHLDEHYGPPEEEAGPNESKEPGESEEPKEM